MGQEFRSMSVLALGPPILVSDRRQLLHGLKRDERCTNVNTKGRVLKYLANISDDSRDVLYRHFVMADSDEMRSPL